MRLFLLGPAFVAALMLAGCGSTSTNQPPVVIGAPPPVPSGNTALSADAQKALAGAEILYNVPAQAYAQLKKDGVGFPSEAQAKSALLGAYQALVAARHLAAIGDSAGVLSSVQQVKDAVAVAKSALPPQ